MSTPQDDAMPNFFHESRSLLLVLSINVSFIFKLFWKGDKNFKNQTSGPIYMEDPVKHHTLQIYLITMIIVIGRKINYSVLDGWIFSRVHPPRQ